MSEITKVAEKEPTFAFGKKERKLLTDPLNDNNPITVQVLGICSALAVTTKVDASFVMAIAVVFVCAFSNLIISLLRNSIPKSVRMIVQLVAIATLVTIVELVLKAANYTVFTELSVFIGLIITNCIVMGRLEAFAMANGPWKSFLDGIGNGIGYGIILIAVAAIRELFGKGTFYNIQILGDWYTPNGLMVLFPSAMFVIGILIWIHRSWNRDLIDVS